MVYWKDYKIKKYSTYEHKKRTYTNVILSFDCETTTFFYVNNKWVVQDFNKNPDIYSNAEKRVVPYIWQMGINDDVVYGREMCDYIEFLKRFCKINQANNLIFIHNLGYDFAHFCEYLPNDLIVFSKAAYKPMYVKSKIMHCEFRCSYMLTNMSLATCAEQYNLNVKKLKGTMAYNVARTPNTELTSDELLYCEYDVRVINEMIKTVYIPRYGCIANIPLTQTGEVRRIVKEELSKSQYYMHNVKKMSPTFEQYHMATRLLQGGYTHLNYFYNGRVLTDVTSYDKSSSYPHVMCTKKYPMSPFMEYDCKYDCEKNYCYIMLVEYTKLKSKTAWCYIARHKTQLCFKGHNDNGKLLEAERVIMWVTDVDYNIIDQNYTKDSVKILKCYRAFANYLPIKFVKMVLKQYASKTALRGIDTKYALYLHNKQLLNANFGMCVTNDIKEEHIFNPITKEWELPEPLTDEDIQEKIRKQRPFLSYFWGIYITAYARRDLWEILHNMSTENYGLDCIYTDTDSVKIKNAQKYIDIIQQFNDSVDKEIARVCEDRGLDINLFYPKDKDGNTHPLGHFELDGEYSKFKSLGSKKYCYVDKKTGKFKFVVAGLKKEYVDVDGVHKTITDMTQFELPNKETKKGGVIPNGRTVFWRLRNQPRVTLCDRDGKKYIATNKNGIAIINANYTFSLENEYSELVEKAKNTIYDGCNEYTNYFNFT